MNNRKYFFGPVLIFLISIIYPVFFTFSPSSAQDKPPRKELIWYECEKCYYNLDEVKEALDNGELLHPPEYFSDLEIINEAVGDIDPDNAEYYWAAKPETLGLLLHVAGEYKKRLKDKNAEIHISGLLRTLEYQDWLSQYNNWADLGRSTHTNGATFDITIHPYYVKDVNKINTLQEILNELHDKEDIFFIDESANSCFHVCINPLLREKYSLFFHRITRGYEISSYYTEGSTIFTSLKDEKNLKKSLKDGSLIDISSIPEDKLSLDLCLPENKHKEYYSLRPETAGLLIAISDEMQKSIGKNFKLSISELVRTSKDQENLIKEDVLTPENSPFLYGAAFQIDISKMKEKEIAKIKDYLENLSKAGDIVLVEREDKKYDIIMNPRVISKYRLVYNEKFPPAERKIGFSFELRYLYIALALTGGLILGFIIFRFYRLRQIIKQVKKSRKRKKAREKKKKQTIHIEELNKMPEISDLKNPPAEEINSK